jgi:hypothetical protein
LEERRYFKQIKNGTFKGVFNIDKDAAYEFKYVIDGAFVNEIGSRLSNGTNLQERKQCFRGLNL